MIIWFTGISGVGKTTIAKKLHALLSKKLILIDGDALRKINNYDLGYTKEDRDVNAKRLINLVEYLSNQKIDIIVCANITSLKFRKIVRKKLRKFYEIHISAKIDNLLKRDYKNLYKNALKKKINNVVGFDIPYKKPKSCYMYLENNLSKKDFLKNAKIIKKKLFNSKKYKTLI